MNAHIIESPILTEIFGKSGYSTAFSITDHELEYFRDLINKQWIAHIESTYPEHAARFREAGLERYHELSHLVSHSDLWPKEQRVLSREAVEKALQLDFIRRLRTLLGIDFRVSDVLFFSESIAGYPEIYWRLVRPGVTTDVGGMHADRWFHDVQDTLFGDDETTLKMWLPIFTEAGRNGLFVVPGSHLKNWRVKYTRESTALVALRLTNRLPMMKSILFQSKLAKRYCSMKICYTVVQSMLVQLLVSASKLPLF